MRNEEEYIVNCLDSIFANDFPREKYEVLVADGDSTDRSRELILQKAAIFDNIKLLRNKQKIVPIGLNEAIRQARGRYIIRLDAHCEYPPTYIRECVNELERTGAANVGGRCVTQPGAHTPIARAIALLTQIRAGVGNSAYRIGAGDRYVDTVPFGAFRREIFDKIGLYREDLVRNQDYELNARIRKHGGRIFLSSKIHFIYYNSPTAARFMRQGVLNGFWNALCWRQYPVAFCWRHAVPAAFVGTLLGSLLLGTFFSPIMSLFFAISGLYVAIALTAAFQIGMNSHDWRAALLAPGLMFTYHFVYGLGTLVGLFDNPITAKIASLRKPQRNACIRQ
jgi:glycosyltransferase involved in cell wall biosynthesis